MSPGLCRSLQQTRQSLRPRHHLRVERTRSTTPAISCPVKAPFRKTKVALDGPVHTNTLPFDASAPSSFELYNLHLCIFLFARLLPAPSRARVTIIRLNLVDCENNYGQF